MTLRPANCLAAAIICLTTGWHAAQAEEAQSHYTLVQNVLEKHVIPRVTALKDAAAELAPAVAQVCKTGDEGMREELSGDFRRVVEAWAGVWFLRFGPLEQASRRERFSFWPDPRGIMTRQLRQVLAAKDPGFATAEAVGKQSAAVQGLPALEVILTDKDVPLGPGEASQYRCQAAQSLAGNLEAVANDIFTEWTKEGGWKDKMLRPGSDNDTYKEPSEAANDVMKSFLMGLQLTGDVLVKPRLDPKFVAASGAFAKSNLSSDYYEQTVASLAALYEVSAIESYLPEDKDWAKNWAGGAWKTMKASDGTGGPNQGVDKKDAPPLKELMSRISGLRQLMAKEMITAAGLTVGFNELDGD